MNKDLDYVVAGAGLSGCVFARIMAEKGKKVLIIEKRNEIGGNVHDYVNGYGILVQKYGPHIFHTSEKSIVQFISKYANWQPYKLKCEVNMLGKSTPSPFNFKTIDQFYTVEKASALKLALKKCYPSYKTINIIDLLNSEVSIIKEYALFLFENDYSKYTAKQWGIDASKIDVNILKRVPVRLDYDDGYFSDSFEALPANGFTSFISNLLNHNNIQIMVNTNILDYISLDNQNQAIKFKNLPTNDSTVLVYTGQIDTFFKYKYGQLPYRSLYFKYATLEVDNFQNAPVVAYPQEKEFTRITEFKKLTAQNIISNVTTIAYEYPTSYSQNDEFEPYYPIITDNSILQYQKYKDESNKYDNLILCGRLADFKYYNMDQAILRVFELTKELI